MTVTGCTNDNADNFNPIANEDDGSCTFGGGLSTGLSYDVVSADPLGTGETTYRIYANFSSNDVELIAMYGTDTEPWILDGDAPLYQDALSVILGSVSPFSPLSQHCSTILGGPLRPTWNATA